MKSTTTKSHSEKLWNNLDDRVDRPHLRQAKRNAGLPSTASGEFRCQGHWERCSAPCGEIPDVIPLKSVPFRVDLDPI